MKRLDKRCWMCGGTAFMKIRVMRKKDAEALWELIRVVRRRMTANQLKFQTNAVWVK